MSIDFTEDRSAMDRATTLEEKDAAIRSMNEKVYAEWAVKAPEFFERMEARVRELEGNLSITEHMTVEYVIAGMKLKKSLGFHDYNILAGLLRTSQWWVLTGEEGSPK
jgi:hypothetical protein